MYRKPEYDLDDEGVSMHVCDGCGREAPCIYGPDPYAADIYQDYRDVWLCNNCDYNKRMDI